MRLALDANLSSKRIGEPLRAQGHDVLGVADQPDLDGFGDEELLQLVASDRRILVTRNSRDFAPICRRWAEGGQEHAGVILVWTLSARQHGEVIRGVERWLAELPDHDRWRGLVVAL